MNVLFLTLSSFTNLNERGIYYDLIRKIVREGHSVFVVSPIERKFKQSTELKGEGNCHILRVKTLNIQKTNVIEKGIGTILLEYQFKSAIKKYLKNIKFDLIIYSTPPITITSTIEYIKKRDNAQSYLLLKDIFPQNAVDLEMISNGGLLHRFFQRKEKQLYKISDYIGCMSPANVEYLLCNHPELEKFRIEVCPNSIELPSVEKMDNTSDRSTVRRLYNIPENATVFVYGGNLGKPQGIDFLIDILNSNNNKSDRFFVIVGSGTEFSRIQDKFNENKYSNALLSNGLPKKEYDNLLGACDVGLIFLDTRFTIPNYPSRLLSYLEYRIPILCATDTVTDIGKIAEENYYGFSSISGDITTFNKNMERFIQNRNLINSMGDKGYNYLINNYLINQSYDIIMKHFNK